MLDYANLTDDQLEAIDRIFEHDETFLYAPMGAGKTVVALTAIQELMHEGVINKVLVLGTKKVCESVWRQERDNWAHLKDLPITFARPAIMRNCLKDVLYGNPDPHIVLVNNENVPLLFSHDISQHFDGLVVDELSKYSAPGGKSFRALRKNRKQFKHVLGMTGTPVSEQLQALYGQCLIVDGGATFGRNKDKFLRKHFYPTDFEQRKWAVLPGQEDVLAQKVAPLMHIMPDYRGRLPKLREKPVYVGMSRLQEAHYIEMVRDMTTTVHGVEVVAETSAVQSQKLEQLAQGFLYAGDEKQGEGLGALMLDRAHYPLKIRALKETLARCKGPTVVAYWYQQDANFLKSALKDAVFLEKPEDVEAWNRGEIPILCLHPRSAGHGLNMAQGGANIIFYSQIWSNDVYQQTIARLWRKGQTRNVNVWNLITRDSVDEVKVSSRLGKEDKAVAFRAHLENYR